MKKGRKEGTKKGREEGRKAKKMSITWKCSSTYHIGPSKDCSLVLQKLPLQTESQSEVRVLERITAYNVKLKRKRQTNKTHTQRKQGTYTSTNTNPSIPITS